VTGTRPLRAVADVVLGKMRTPDSDTGTNVVPYLRTANVGDGFLRLHDVKHMHFEPAELARYRLAVGDVLITEASGSRDQVGQTALFAGEVPGAAMQNTLLRLRPRQGTDARYLYWWSRFAFGSGMYAEASQGLGIWHLGSERMQRLQVPAMPLHEQRRIADFLDDRVALLDRAVTLRETQAHLLRERHLAWIENVLVQQAANFPVRPLAWLCDPLRPIQYGIVLPGPNHEGGVPIVKGGDVAAGRLHPDLLQRTSPEIDQQYARSRVREGDLVISIRGSYGEVEKVPRVLNGANLTQDSARIAPAHGDIDWLKAVLETPSVQSQMQQRATGAMVKGLNIFELRRLAIPTPASNVQAALGRRVRQEAERVAEARALLKQSGDLIAERKQALVTAAVTGQFDATTARSVA